MADNNFRSTRSEISALLKEQHQLRATETKLKAMIEKVNGHLNQLLVEELQLKSREFEHQYPLNSGQCQNTSEKSESNATSDQINKQELNLNIQHTKLMKSLEESEEDE